MASVQVFIDGVQIGVAQNSQKKMAQKLAARNALAILKEKDESKEEGEKQNGGAQFFTWQALNEICLWRQWPMPQYRYANEGGHAHAKRFVFAVRVNTSDRGWTKECVGDPIPSVKKAKDSTAILLLQLLDQHHPDNTAK